MKKRLNLIKQYTLLLVFLASAGLCRANNIEVSGISLTGQNTDSAYVLVQFDLSWENSWRLDGSNWDAAWVFVKYSADNGSTWRHALLSNSGNSAGSGTDAGTVQVGLLDEKSSYDATTNPGIGAFVYRSAAGSGTFSLSSVQLKWNYGDNGLSDNVGVLVKVFAVEMVYVPAGKFYLGSGGSETGHFYTYDGSTTTTPYLVSSEAAISVGATAGYLYYSSSYGALGSIPAAFPKGYAGFYCMKYEISQGQYADFLSTLTATQVSNLYSSTTEYRYSITGTTGSYSASYPYVACGDMNPIDYCAYTDWAGLRPMTELEFEKACRGEAYPVANEFAWGTPYIASSAYSFTNGGTSTETVSGNYSTNPVYGNACYTTTYSSGPLRVGIFAANSSNTGRVSSGASYYGIMELSGNAKEKAVWAGNAAGLAFTGTNGDGTLASSGYATNSDWPGYTNGYSGYMTRGGGYAAEAISVEVSDRSEPATSTARYGDWGGRSVRGLPTSAAE